MVIVKYLKCNKIRCLLSADMKYMLQALLIRERDNEKALLMLTLKGLYEVIFKSVPEGIRTPIN
jgi:hypothetical protein